jgi:outer membrane receptor protein involved in Fe transport
VNNWFRIYGQLYVNFKRREVGLENVVTKELEHTLGKRRRVGTEVRGLFTTRWINIGVGGDLKFDLVNNKNILPHIKEGDLTQNIYGVFADTEIRPHAKLILGLGARLDYYDIPENVWRAPSFQVSPRASVIVQALPQLTVRANYGRAFRAPTLMELGINQQMYAATLIGNPFLRAEKVDTVELALDAWPYKDWLRLTLTGFYNKAANLINQEHLDGATSQFMNIGDAHAAGFEAEASAQIPKWAAAFDVAYQFLSTRADVPALGTTDSLDYAASHRVYLRAHKRLAIGPISSFIDFYGLYVGERRDPAIIMQANGEKDRVLLPGYFVANARIGADLYRGFSAALIATNLFNAKYQEMLGFPAPGVSVYAELRYQY